MADIFWQNNDTLEYIFDILFTALSPFSGSEWDFTFKRPREKQFLDLATVCRWFYNPAIKALYRCIDFSYLDRLWSNDFAPEKVITSKLLQLQNILPFYVNSVRIFRMPRQNSEPFLKLLVTMENLQEISLPQSEIETIHQVLDMCPTLESLKYWISPSAEAPERRVDFKTHKLRILECRGFGVSSNFCFDPATVNLLKTLPFLDKLVLTDVVISPNNWALDSNAIAHLKSISIEGSKLTDMTNVLVRLFGWCNGLRTVRLMWLNCILTDVFFAIADNLHNVLHEFEVEHTGSICPKGFQYFLTKCTRLRLLHIGEGCVLDPIVFKRLSVAGFRSNSISTLYYGARDPLPSFIFNVVIKIFPQVANLSVLTDESPDNWPLTVPASIKTLPLDTLCIRPIGKTLNSYEVLFQETIVYSIKSVDSILDMLPRLRRMELGYRSLRVLHQLAPLYVIEWMEDSNEIEWTTTFVY